jgi:hypothetical protein
MRDYVQIVYTYKRSANRKIGKLGEGFVIGRCASIEMSVGDDDSNR